MKDGKVKVTRDGAYYGTIPKYSNNELVDVLRELDTDPADHIVSIKELSNGFNRFIMGR